MVAPSQYHVLVIVMVVCNVIGRCSASIGNGNGGSVRNGCSDVCDYNEWGKDARCESRDLRAIPQECRGAKTLRAQGNRIARLQSGAFQNFTCLKYLYLQGNNITLEPGSFRGCSKVQQLQLNDNEVPMLTPDITEGLQSVLFMYLDNVGVQTVLADTFKDMRNLQYISLKNNKLTTPPCGAFGTDSNLRTLYLSNNMISYLPDSCFSGLSRLDKLYLNNNSLSNINEQAFRGLESLILLNLENTNLVQVPTGIFTFANKIKTLHLSFNKIMYLSNRDFLGLSGLEELYLQYNQLTSIHAQAFEFLGTLRVLNISYNLISSIGDGALGGQTLLEELALQNNRLNSTRNITFTTIPQTAKVRLENNPLHCDCAIYPFRYWLEMSSPQTLADSTEGASESRQASCVSPPKFAGRLVIEITRHDICPGNVHNVHQSLTVRMVPETAAQQADGVQDNSENAISTVQIVAIATAFIIVFMVICGVVAWLVMRRRNSYDSTTGCVKKHVQVRVPPQNPHTNQHMHADQGHCPVNITENPPAPDLPPRPDPRSDLRSMSVSSTAPLLRSYHPDASIGQNPDYIHPDALPRLIRSSTAPELDPTCEISESDEEEDPFYDKVQKENAHYQEEDCDEPPDKWIERNLDSSGSVSPTSAGGQPVRFPPRTGPGETSYVQWSVPGNA